MIKYLEIDLFFIYLPKYSFSLENMEMINLTGSGKIKILKSSEVSKLRGKCSYHVLLVLMCVF